MKKVFIMLTQVVVHSETKECSYHDKYINMSRCQEIDSPDSFEDGKDWVPLGTGAILTMNIPNCYVAVRETPDQVVAVLNAANSQENDDGSR
jgi:hypothetical protein